MIHVNDVRRNYTCTIGEMLDFLKQYPDNTPIPDVAWGIFREKIIKKQKQREATKRYRKKQEK